MKTFDIDRLDAHDRYEHLLNQNFSISECCQDLINKRPFGENPFYIFAHARTDDDGVTKRLIWQPRLTKPKSQTNSMLFKAYPGQDLVKIIWIIPPREMWSQYQKGKMTQSEDVMNSINAFQHNRSQLDAPEPDDLDDVQIDQIYKQLSLEAKTKKLRDRGLIIPI